MSFVLGFIHNYFHEEDPSETDFFAKNQPASVRIHSSFGYVANSLAIWTGAHERDLSQGSAIHDHEQEGGLFREELLFQLVSRDGLSRDLTYIAYERDEIIG